MTHEERAVKVYNSWRQGLTVPDELFRRIAAALRQVEQETWEQAARAVENGRFLTNESPEYNFGQKVAMMLRAKAKEAS